MLHYENVNKRLREMGHQDLLSSSAVRPDDLFARILHSLKPRPKAIVEIGTYRGIATIVLASMAPVVTFDVVHQEIAEKVWEAFGVRDQIEYVIIEAYKEGYDRETAKKIGIHRIIKEGIDHDLANAKIRQYLEETNVQADLTFIDGTHKYKECKADHEATMHYGRTIFHDTIPKYIGVMKLMQEIEARTINEFGIWKDKSKYR